MEGLAAALGMYVGREADREVLGDRLGQASTAVSAVALNGSTRRGSEAIFVAVLCPIF